MKQANKGVQPVVNGQPPAEFVEKRPPTEGNSSQSTVTGTQGLEASLSGLARVREAAIRDPHLQFTNVYHHITVELLRKAFFSLNKKAAPGVDGVTWASYKEDLDSHLEDLHERIQSGRYRAKPSERAWIPKSDGRQRPLGKAALEDKIVQQALVWVMEAIYEVDFLGFSYGFRPGKGPHDALDAVYVAIMQGKVNWVLDADIKSFFDTIEHKWMVKFIEHRIKDPRVIRLIKKFLRVGVLDGGRWTRTEVGTPQGSVLSPLLANVYLHYVLDLWVNEWRKRHARGKVYIVRYADDSFMGFQYKSDAERFLGFLKERLAQFGLEIHERKSRLIEFGRFAAKDRRARGDGKPETFDFLGFTHICARRRSDGKFTVRRRTIAKRLRSKLKQLRATLMRIRHEPVSEQGRWIRSVVQGHFNYFAVPGNQQALQAFRTQTVRTWMHSLRRRSQKARNLTWERFARLITKWVPSVRIVHPYPNQRLCVCT